MCQDNLWTVAEINKLQKLVSAGKTPKDISAAFDNRSYDAVRHKITQIKSGRAVPGAVPNLPEAIFERLKKEPVKVLDLAREYGLTTRDVENVIFDLSKSKNITISNGIVSIIRPNFGQIDIEAFSGEWQHYGLVADTHLGCKEERLD